MAKLINYDFVVVFNEFLRRFDNKKHYLKIISYKGRLYLDDSIYITKHYFSVFLFKLILLKKQIISLFDFFFLNFSNLLIKDYRIFYFLESYCRYNKLIIKKFHYFNNNFLDLITSYDSFKFRIDIITFFTLGRYVEYLRSFMYNQYLSILPILAKYSAIRKHLRIPLFDRWDWLWNFRKNIFMGSYVIYNNFTIKKDYDFIPLSLNQNPFIYSNKAFNLFIKYLYIYKTRFLWFFYIYFISCLRPYFLLYCYNCWSKYHKYFKYFLRLRLYSFVHLYRFLFKLKFRFYFYILHDLMLFFRLKLKHVFFFNNMQLLLSAELIFKKSCYDLDVLVIDYISRLYYLVLGDFYLSEHFQLSFDFISPWEVLENWGHFDYVLLPPLYNSLDELNLWLFLFKYNMEFFIWHIFNIGPINQKYLFHLDYQKNIPFLEIDVQLDFFSLIFFDFLSVYFFKYCLQSIDSIRLNFVFNFLNDIHFKLALKNPLYYNINSLNIIRLKQFKFFYHNCLHHQRYIKFFNYYIKNVSVYL